MKKIYSKIMEAVMTILMIVPQACETPFDELNTNPNQPASAGLDLVWAHGANEILYKYGRFTNGSDWDTWAGLWTQSFAGNHATGVNYDQYVLRNPDALWGVWYDGFLDLKKSVEMGTEQEAWTHVGASQVLTAMGLGSLTSYYGDIPWSDALQGGDQPFPKFDTQAEIYTTIIAMLGEAIINLQKTPVIALDPGVDIWHGGNSQMWLATAYALVARYENHMSVKDPSGSASRTLAAVASAKAAGFTSAASDLGYPYSGEGNFLNGWFHMFENNQMIASKDFIDALDAKFDPRKEGIWNNLNTDGDIVGYVGKPNGFGTDNTSYSPIGPKTVFGKNNSKQPIVSHFELMFIEAEAQMRAGNAASAATALNTAIQAHMDYVTPSAIEALTTDGGDVIGYETRITNYLATYAVETAASVTMEKIMTEKHTAMVCQNGESWTDIRRHDYAYPSWLAIPVFVGSPVASNFIERVLYPQESVNTNPDNTPTGVTIFDRLWIFK